MCISITRKMIKTEREEYRNDSIYEKKNMSSGGEWYSVGGN